MTSRVEIERAIASGDPHAVAAVFDDPESTAADVVRLATTQPGLVANAEGAPYRIRDLAGRRLLVRTLRGTLEAIRADGAEGDLTARLAELRLIAAETALAGTRVVRLDAITERAVRCIIATGDLDRADNVTVLIPGAATSVARSLTNFGRTARRLRAALERRVPTERFAVVVFLDAASPTLAEVPFNTHAVRGSQRLARFLDGFRARRPDALVTVAAHSYGSTLAAMYLLGRTGTSGVQQFIAYGSAGLPDNAAGVRPTAADFPGLRLHATEARADEEAWLGRLNGNHPHDPTRMPDVFETFSSDGLGDREPVDSHRLEEDPKDVGHRGYLSAGTGSFDTTVELIAGLSVVPDHALT